MEFNFQFHVTIEDFSAEKRNFFIELCRKNEVKPLIISLPRGKYLKQPMFTKLLSNNQLENAIKEINKTADIFKSNNFQPIRIKGEVNAEDYEHFNKIQTSKFKPYYEWHCKVEAQNIPLINELCMKYNGHLSKNSLEENENKKYITIREYKNKEKFYNSTSKMYDILLENNINIVKQKYEYCVYDNRLELDEGWA